MTALRPEVQRYLSSRCPGAAVTPLLADASTRRFWRVRAPAGGTLVLMDYGQPFQGETDDCKLSRVFRAAGLPVAEIVGSSPEAGCLLLEDLGDECLSSALERAQPRGGGPPEPLRRAVVLAARIAVEGTPALARSERARGPALDVERFRYEMDFFLEHYVRGHLRRPEPGSELREALFALADLAAACPHPVLCHRDYHSRNIMVAPDGALSLVDIQDARWGPDTYDLASLLRDAYVEIDESWLPELIELYRSRLESPPSPEVFTRRFRVVSAERMIKALGTFGYQHGLGRGERYAGAIPRTLGRLRLALPALDETRALHATMDRAGLLGA
jgi:aminoglycoside/choline kinase family phosphotransferase